MTVKELIIMLLEHPTDWAVNSVDKDDKDIGVVEPDESAMFVITIPGKEYLQ